MDAEKSDLFCNEDKFKSNDSINQPKNEMTEVCLRESCLLPLDKNVVQEDSPQIQNIYSNEDKVKAECDSILLKKASGQDESNTLVNINSINLNDTLETRVHVNGIPNEKHENHSSLSMNTNLPNENISQELSSNGSLHLNHPHININKTSETDIGTNGIRENMYDNKSEICTNEPLLNANPSHNATVVNELDRMVLTEPENEKMQISLQNNNNDMPEKMDKGLKLQNTLKSTEISIQQGKLDNNSIYRPTLNDDSRLVRISLPTNPMSLMQSNAHFINKSRNFLNFITEKSTNIMEKALLPQHLAMKYNSAYTNTNEKKNMEGPSMKRELSPKHSIPFTEYDIAKNVINPPVSSSYGTTELNKINDHKELPNQTSSILESSSVDLIDSALINTQNNSKLTNLDESVTIEATENLTIAADAEILKDDSAECQDHQKDSGDYVGNYQQTSLLQHPMYLNLLKDNAKLKADNIKLSEKVEALEARNDALEAEKSGELYRIRVGTLEKTIDRLTSELRTALATQEILKREHSAANKEMESMVMKYAVSEEQLIDTQRARDYAERKLKDVIKEQELLQNKLRQIQGERTRICNILDGKCREVAELQKEVEKLTADVNMKEVKLKWAQNKLKTEMELQKDTQQKLDKALSKINEMKEECEQVRKDTEETIKKFQVSEENKAVTLDQQLKEQQARLILERHVIEDKEMLRLQLQKEVEILLQRQQVLIEENNTLSIRIQDHEKQQLEYEDTLKNLKTLVDERQKEIIDLSQKVVQFEALKTQLQETEESLKSTAVELEKLQLANKELESDMHACRQREAAMLDFTLKLTDKNVCLQSEFTALETKTKQLEEEQGPLRDQVNELKHKIKLLEDSVKLEQKRRTEECETLMKQVAEQTQLAQSLAQKLEDSQGENAVLKRKQQTNMKEMTRELQQCRKKLEALESSSPHSSLDVASRTGSNTSLNTGEMLSGALFDNGPNGEQFIHGIECSKVSLIDRIIKLQEDNARKAEKLDFLEEHTQLLVEELQKKKKIIQNYILHEHSGAMGTNERDKNKAELAKYGGIMASVYNQKVSDENMTLKLSLEINQKLQAVLEDTLLKNITLKDNIHTLGEEIAKLTMQNQRKQLTS
ncbi:hypothetical protein KPH14_001484 [Odynerus spinipes]|uniref:Coiled-coil domain-containing protein 186 n=1 Tax=Odynerus spinipes TaxID=1348599 RepID=A0AAD9RUK0_9HYME|nr:hypothetical protein KPH14_001484 [Odynerus spinipes]